MAQLPILQFEEKIVETVEKNPVVVIIGETGSGKSTQLSQILHRRGYTKSGCIAVTQPRRSLLFLSCETYSAKIVSSGKNLDYGYLTCPKFHWILFGRVAQELNVKLGEEVGYAIRFEDRTSEKTLIKYLTDGVLLRESLSNPDLSQYSVIILDEAHERSLNTDILLGLMKRLIKLRASNLKVLITSATLDGEKVSRFFSNCPILNVPGKLFPVEIQHSSERPKSYLEASLKTALDIHVREPEGDVLIFMTGQVRVFSQPPPNCRRFIIATNIAETSLTVDGVVYVIDTGFVKQRQYNPSTGMYSLDVVQISKVQANQRAGRAGRTCPGKCYRLYPSLVYKDDFLDATVPEIQRSSLAGSVLYLKSLDLPDIDILKFDFLDPPSAEALEDALKQLYLIDAIDEDGSITSLGRTMSDYLIKKRTAEFRHSTIKIDKFYSLLPVEDLVRGTNECGCLSHALTVAAMLSAETTLLLGQSKSTDKKRKHTPSHLPDGSGWGDHIQLLQIYELWHQTDYKTDWCKENNLQVRGMMFVKDVRKQLTQIMQKIAKGFANQLAERMIRHNGYRTLGFKSQLVQVHPSSVLKPDEDGMLPNYVVYHELIATSRPYMRNVCAVEMQWVRPILAKLDKINVRKLSGGGSQSHEEVQTENLNLPKDDVGVAQPLDDRESRILAARERFLARSRKANK
ncbi:UNVERIFIED_CONTAM: putative pre-splicing factor ATP-dependent RNA helicase DEAH4 [Sesamum radiatum]|uniref:RNA helicase n=1 Tax=Sesamum radiatum TaxID=300843 RepID=A0AAW2TYQ6_SESRA